MTDAQQTNPTPEPTAQQKAKAVLDSATKLLLAEREIFRKVRDYAKENGISDTDRDAYISYLFSNGSKPAWLEESKDGVKHANHRDIFYVGALLQQHTALVDQYKNAVSEVGALDVNASIQAMRSALANPEANADQTAIAMLNGLKENGANELITTVYGTNATAASFWAAGIDKPEAFTTWFSGLIDNARKAATDAFESVSPTASAAAGAAQEAGGGFMGWLGGLFGGLKDKMSNLSVGGIAGAGGVAALFYLIINSLVGNSWFGKILGVLGGVFGLVLGYRTFGGGGDNEQDPAAPAGPVGQQPQPQQAQGQSQSYDLCQAYQAYQAQRGDRLDLNHDGIVDCGEQVKYFTSPQARAAIVGPGQR